MRLLEIISFSWDRGNLDKGYEKQGVSPKEAEEVFVSEELYVVPSKKQTREKRYIALGRTQQNKSLFVVFTIRKDRIRIILARGMHKKEE